MSNIQISSPLLRKFVHTDASVPTTFTQILGYAEMPSRRIIVVIQNQSSTAAITIAMNSDATTGIELQPGSIFSIDNYNGAIYAKGATSGVPIHIAISSI